MSVRALCIVHVNHNIVESSAGDSSRLQESAPLVGPPGFPDPAAHLAGGRPEGFGGDPEFVPGHESLHSLNVQLADRQGRAQQMSQTGHAGHRCGTAGFAEASDGFA